MADIPARLLDAALQLPDDARECLADRLCDSLDSTDHDDVEDAWSEEIQRRLDQLTSGQERLMPRKPIEVHRLAARDARSARRGYCERSPATERRFVAELARAFPEIASTPERWPTYLRGT